MAAGAILLAAMIVSLGYANFEEFLEKRFPLKPWAPIRRRYGEDSARRSK